MVHRHSMLQRAIAAALRPIAMRCVCLDSGTNGAVALCPSLFHSVRKDKRHLGQLCKLPIVLIGQLVFYFRRAPGNHTRRHTYRTLGRGN
jgi:hypothetical protein